MFNDIDALLSVLVIFIIMYDSAYKHLSIGALLFMCAPMHMYLKGTLIIKNFHKNLPRSTSTINKEEIDFSEGFCKNLCKKVFSL
jgi:hypothetical protein